MEEITSEAEKILDPEQIADMALVVIIIMLQETDKITEPTDTRMEETTEIFKYKYLNKC